MPFRQIFSGRQFRVDAYSRDGGRCEIEDFLTVLEHISPSDWRKLVSLIAKIADSGPFENPDLCRKIDESDGIFEVVSPGGTCIVCLLWAGAITVCFGYNEHEGKEQIEPRIARARWMRNEYLREGSHERLSTER